MKLSWNCRTMASPVMRFSVLLRVVAILPLSSQRIFSTREMAQRSWSLRLTRKSVAQQRPTEKADTRLVPDKQTQTRNKTTSAQSAGASLYFQDKMLEVMSACSPSSAAFKGCRNSHLLMWLQQQYYYYILLYTTTTTNICVSRLQLVHFCKCRQKFQIMTFYLQIMKTFLKILTSLKNEIRSQKQWLCISK